jgi:hypothetical protein
MLKRRIVARQAAASGAEPLGRRRLQRQWRRLLPVAVLVVHCRRWPEACKAAHLRPPGIGRSPRIGLVAFPETTIYLPTCMFNYGWIPVEQFARYNLLLKLDGRQMFI